jgi:hypothetical protein
MAPDWALADLLAGSKLDWYADKRLSEIMLLLDVINHSTQPKTLYLCELLLPLPLPFAPTRSVSSFNSR